MAVRLSAALYSQERFLVLISVGKAVRCPWHLWIIYTLKQRVFIYDTYECCKWLCKRSNEISVNFKMLQLHVENYPFNIKQIKIVLSLYNTKFWEELIANVPWYDMGRIQNDGSNNSTAACIFVTAVMYLPSRCLATIGGYKYIVSW
jgi:hypothetical protein